MSIFYSEEAKKKLYGVYDSFMEDLGEPFEDIYTDTRYGKLHMVKVGNKDGKPLLIYPGFSVTAPFQLLVCKYFLKDYCCYGIDIIGHPGKSEDCVIPNDYHAYGNMVNDALENIGLDSVYAFASSLECGMLTDLMAVAPEKVKKAILYVPAIIGGNLFIQVRWSILKQLGHKFKSTKILRRSAYLMSQKHGYKNEYETLASNTTFRCMKEASVFKLPKPEEVYRCNAKTLLLMGELDKFYPEKSIRKAAPHILSNPEYYQMKDHGHIGKMSDECKQVQLDFLAK